MAKRRGYPGQHRHGGQAGGDQVHVGDAGVVRRDSRDRRGEGAEGAEATHVGHERGDRRVHHEDQHEHAHHGHGLVAHERAERDSKATPQRRDRRVPEHLHDPLAEPRSRQVADREDGEPRDAHGDHDQH